MIFAKRNIVNLPIIFKLLGLLLLIEAVFMLPPLFVSWGYGEIDTVKAFAITLAITAGCGSLSFMIPIRNRDMGKREGFLLTGLTWVVFSIFGMIPFLLEPCKLPLEDAFFETMSGLTTTGASVISEIESQSHGILLWRAITHFIGGMGIILFTLAVIPMLNKQSGLQLFNAEVTGLTHEKIRPRVSHTAKTLWSIYTALNIVLILLLWIGPMDWFDALCQGMSTIATGGFSTKNASVIGFDSNYVKIVICVFMFLAGISFTLIYRISKGDIKSLIKSDIVRYYLFVIVIAVIIIGTIEYFQSDEPLSRLIVDIPFQTVSALTSSGFNATDINLWHHGSMVIVIVLMAMGACAGSTTGGIKIDRIVLVCKTLRNELYRVLFPNTITPVRINGKIVNNEIIVKVIAFMALYVIFFLIGSVLLSLSGIPMFDSMFASVSCVSNNGLGFGFTGSSFASISVLGKWVLSALMLVGRLEFFTIIILFTRSFWSK